MDPITATIIAALDSLRDKDIQREYYSLKATLARKFGADSELIQAVNRLEESPDSKARQAILQETVARSRAAQDEDVHQVAVVLVEQLKALPGSNINIAGQDPDIDIKGGDISTWRGEASTGSEPSGPGEGPPR